MPAQAVVAEIERDPVQPCIEGRPAALPAARLPPQPDKGFLGDILGFIPVAKHPRRQGEQARQLACHHGSDGRIVMLADLHQQFFIRVAIVQGFARLPLLL